MGVANRYKVYFIKSRCEDIPDEGDGSEEKVSRERRKKVGSTSPRSERTHKRKRDYLISKIIMYSPHYVIHIHIYVY